MFKKKQVLTVAGILCVIAMSMSILYVYAPSPWITQDMVDYMYNVGRHKIWRTNYIVKNEIKPMVEDIQDKMGQGLGGEVIVGETITQPGRRPTIWTYSAPTDNPKKVSFWINLRNMKDGDSLLIGIWYASDASGGVYQNVDDTPTRQFRWSFVDSQIPIPPKGEGKLIIDELPVASGLAITVAQSMGTPFTISWHAIIEEM